MKLSHNFMLDRDPHLDSDVIPIIFRWVPEHILFSYL